MCNRGFGRLGIWRTISKHLRINQNIVLIQLVDRTVISPPHIHLYLVAAVHQARIMAIIIGKRRFSRHPATA
ncbi:hypothetical protein D3C73_694500 [compost metagenome]